MKTIFKNAILKNIKNPVSGKSIDISKETLSKADYAFIAEIVTSSPYLQKVDFPPCDASDIRFILRLFNKATIKNSIITEINFHLPYDMNQLSTEEALLYNQIESRLKRNRNKIFGIHGGGNIGLGLMADIINKSGFDYQVMATTSQPFLKTLINSNHQFQLQHGDSKTFTEIEKVHMVSRDVDDIIDLYQNSSLMAICLTTNAFTDSINEITTGLINRYRADGSSLKILVLMNMPDNANFVKNAIINEINIIIEDPDEAKKIAASLEIIPTVIDRIVNRISDDDIKVKIKESLLSYASKEFIESPVLKKQMDKIIEDPKFLTPAIKQFDIPIQLFNAESQFAFYVPKGTPEMDHFCEIRQVKSLSQIEHMKNKFINGPHAILAWLGALCGCKMISDAIRFEGVQDLIEDVMLKEIAPVLKAEYPDITDDELIFQKNLFIERCMNSQEDPVIRVGRDPLRKLESQGRIVGTLELHQKHSLNTPTFGLELGISAAILYSIYDHDKNNFECQIIRDIYHQKRSFKDILCYQGEHASSRFKGLDPKHDKTLIDRILNKIHYLQLNYSKKNIFLNLMKKPKKHEFDQPSREYLFTQKNESKHVRFSNVVTYIENRR